MIEITMNTKCMTYWRFSPRMGMDDSEQKKKKFTANSLKD